MKEIVINANKLSCQSGHHFLLKDIDWTVFRGDHWVVFGMNGSGKTTLLSLIAGFKKQTSGELEIFGELYGEDNVLSLRRRIGWVSSSFFDKIFFKESAIHIVLSGLLGTFCPDDSIADDNVVRAKELLRKMNLGDKIDRPYNTMSKGEQQSVLIARALMARPEILALDEPGTGLDIQARDNMLKIVQNLSTQTDITIIYITHYPEEILPVFDQCLFLKNGRNYAIGKTKDLMTCDSLSGFMEKNVTVEEDSGHFQVRIHSDLTVGNNDTHLYKEV